MPDLTTLIEQEIYTVPSFTIECGAVLKQAPVAYKTWGTLNAARDNVMIICHAFTGSANVEDWWGPLMGRGRAFDPSRFFIFCANVLGSPYGSASPITTDPDTGHPYGPTFPPTTIRDDVRIHKLVLDHLSITSIAVVVGGSMGGMAVLEWPLCTPLGYVRHIIPIATSARHSAWCISWGEAQRQSIYSDPAYMQGFYYQFSDEEGGKGKQPVSGLAAARMSALLTYRSRDSFERRFGRRNQVPRYEKGQGVLTPPESPKTEERGVDALARHNDGNRGTRGASSSSPGPSSSPSTADLTPTSTPTSTPNPAPTQAPSPPPIFSAQSYLRYQGDKFTARFDANCYIHITRKLDTHDVSRGRELPSSSSSFSSSSSLSPIDPSLTDTDPLPHRHRPPPSPTPTPSLTDTDPLPPTLSSLPPALIISIATDGLFTPSEQLLLSQHIPESELVTIPSPDGHDGFLLEFEAIDRCILRFLSGRGVGGYDGEGEGEGEEQEVDVVGRFEVKKTSVFGEAEADVAQW